MMGLSYQQAKALGIEQYWPTETRAMPAEPPPSKAPDDGMNKTERRWSWRLEAAKDWRRIREWQFETIKFRMADRTWYKPDFSVLLNSGHTIFIEVKASKSDGSILWRDDAAVKIKTIAEIQPYPFFLAVARGLRWEISRLPSKNWGWINVDVEWLKGL